jgi:hypothetical protein
MSHLSRGRESRLYSKSSTCRRIPTLTQNFLSGSPTPQTRERYFYIEKDELKFIAKAKEMFGWLKNSKPAIGCFATAGAFVIMAISLIADIGIFDSGLSHETLGALINVAVLMLHIAGGCIVASVACAVWDSNKI